MIKSNLDLYKVIEEIEADLVRANQPLKAEQLKRAMYISGHPGEIFGELKLALRDLLAQPGLLNGHTRILAEEAKKSIEDVIG